MNLSSIYFIKTSISVLRRGSFQNGLCRCLAENLALVVLLKLVPEARQDVHGDQPIEAELPQEKARCERAPDVQAVQNPPAFFSRLALKKRLGGGDGGSFSGLSTCLPPNTYLLSSPELPCIVLSVYGYLSSSNLNKRIFFFKRVFFRPKIFRALRARTFVKKNIVTP